MAASAPGRAAPVIGCWATYERLQDEHEALNEAATSAAIAAMHARVARRLGFPATG